MPRIARFVWPGLPHHVTQRGNRRGPVFFSDADYQTYLSLLREYSTQHEVEVLAYCLMPNHVHLILIPVAKNSLALSLRRVHTRYAQRINRSMQWKGHLWQGRYFSSVLDEHHCWAAIRYVERNPLRARMVAKAEDYPWSSARAHCGHRQDPLLTRNDRWLQQIEGIGDWSAWLAESDDENMVDALRRSARRGLPCGSDEFVNRLEWTSGRRLQERRRAKGVRPL